MSQPGWTLPAALGIGPPKELVALVGGGGKTSLMIALAESLPGRVVMTTTTRIFAAQTALAPAVCPADDLSQLVDHLDAFGRCLVIGPVQGDKATGVDPTLPELLLARPDVDFVLVEADGARMRPIKAPAAHEPVIPPGTTLLVPMAGIDALAGPLDAVAHRPELVRDLLAHAGHSLDLLTRADQLTPAGLAALLIASDGGLKNAPTSARVVPFINKVQTAEQFEDARQAAGFALHMAPAVSRLVVGTVRTPQPVREVWRRVQAVVLAAGESQRMGRNKLLLPWNESTVLEQTVANVQASLLVDLLIVTGHDADAITQLPTLHQATFLNNSNYQQGMLSSVQTAVRQAPSTWEAVLVVLGDQPMVGPHIIDQIVTTYAEHPAGLVVPRHDGRRGNPVLIDRRYFAELLALPVDSAPRALLERHPDDIAWVDTASDAVLHDLDRPDDYARWLPR